MPNPPITAVTSVKRVNFDGTLTAFAGWVWDGGVTLYGMAIIGSPMINAPEAWADNWYTPLVEVTYSHGDAEAIGNLVRQWETSPYAVPVGAGPGPAPALQAAGLRAPAREVDDHQQAGDLEQHRGDLLLGE